MRASDRTVGLPIGTRVVRNDPFPGRRPPRFGWVMPHQPEYTHGAFPVRWDDGIWQAQLDASDVTVVPSHVTTVTLIPQWSASKARAVS